MEPVDVPPYQVIGGRLDVAGGPLLVGVQRGAAAVAAGDAGGRLLGQGPPFLLVVVAPLGVLLRRARVAGPQELLAVLNSNFLLLARFT